jgi:hypothetical protein
LSQFGFTFARVKPFVKKIKTIKNTIPLTVGLNHPSSSSEISSLPRVFRERKATIRVVLIIEILLENARGSLIEI